MRWVGLTFHCFPFNRCCFVVWSIVATHSFRDPDSCDWSTFDRFPPKQKPTLLAIVLNKLIETLDTPAGAEILSSPTLSEITAEQQMQLVERMHGVVKDLIRRGL